METPKTKHSFKIAADSLEEYTRLEEQLIQLPDTIKKQIEMVEYSLAGTKCTFKKAFYGEVKLELLTNIKRIAVQGDSITASGGDFLFVIPYDVGSKPKFEFVFVDPLKRIAR